MNRKPLSITVETTLISLFLLSVLISGCSTQPTCSRANCASCGTVGPCGQCSKGYQLSGGGCKALTPTPEQEESKVDTFVLVVAIIGGLVFLAIIVWIASCCYKKERPTIKVSPTPLTNLGR